MDCLKDATFRTGCRTSLNEDSTVDSKSSWFMVQKVLTVLLELT